MTDIPRFSDSKYQKYERDAAAATDALASADAMDQIHKRCQQLTDIYKAEIAVAIRAAAALHDDVDQDDRLKWLDADLGELRENAFDDFPALAQATREKMKGGW